MRKMLNLVRKENEEAGNDAQQGDFDVAPDFWMVIQKDGKREWYRKKEAAEFAFNERGEVLVPPRT